ncbi:hypothetical protein M011DRAFT_478647 [Sporormia fimetaria CBS 119925]|uniref:Thioesterase domain-containing protein n=1 Tax=Sporormia fimetaria CBS 119925 TaxID=1340428 RepID=A0A6A6V7L0_9PLEO|nr:hypothetical protein M011DRAFT_478647 [Sporormia fimetaria CBS 119925]
MPSQYSPIARLIAFRSVNQLWLHRIPVARGATRHLSTSPPRNPRFDDIRTSRISLRYLFYFLFTSIGAGAGLTLRAYATARLDPPAPGSEEDAIALEALEDQMDNLDVVKHMRAQESLADAAVRDSKEGRGGWTEVDILDYANIGRARTRPLTQQAMSGIQGLGVQRAFFNSETRELVAVVWIGPRLTGWPGIAHGGALATLFEETMSRMIAGPNVPIDSIPIPTSMSVTYARPTQSFNMYILRASFTTPDLPQDEPPTEPLPGKLWLPSWKDFTKSWTPTEPPAAPLEISGSLESLDGQVKARAKGTWPASAIP